jgi:antitoxin VapB
MPMQVTTVFKKGTSTQAVRIPKEFRLLTKEVWIEKRGESLVITPRSTSWDDFFDDKRKLSADFKMDRNEKAAIERKALLFQEKIC